MQKYLADILSVLALTMSAEGERVCLTMLGLLVNLLFLLIGLVIMYPYLFPSFAFWFTFLVISTVLYSFHLCAHRFQESLKYRLLGSDGDIGSWGHEYVRSESSSIGQ